MTEAIGPDIDVTTCPCYGCAVARQRVGVILPDPSADPCDPPGACAGDGRCWTHSEWVDEARCDPPGACASGARCAAHGKASDTARETTITVGDTVEWDRWDGSGTARGVVCRIVDGRIYIEMRYVNRRGKRRERTTECWFDPEEIHRLRMIANG